MVKERYERIAKWFDGRFVEMQRENEHNDEIKKVADVYEKIEEGNNDTAKSGHDAVENDPDR